MPVNTSPMQRQSGAIALSHRKNYRKTFLHELASPTSELSTSLSNLFAKQQAKKRKRDGTEDDLPPKKMSNKSATTSNTVKRMKRKREECDIIQQKTKMPKNLHVSTGETRAQCDKRCKKNTVDMQEPIDRGKMFYNTGLITFGAPFKLIHDEDVSLIGTVFHLEVHLLKRYSQ